MNYDKNNKQQGAVAFMMIKSVMEQQLLLVVGWKTVDEEHCAHH
jgi:hypothetical protein